MALGREYADHTGETVHTGQPQEHDTLRLLHTALMRRMVKRNEALFFAKSDLVTKGDYYPEDWHRIHVIERELYLLRGAAAGILFALGDSSYLDIGIKGYVPLPVPGTLGNGEETEQAEG